MRSKVAPLLARRAVPRSETFVRRPCFNNSVLPQTSARASQHLSVCSLFGGRRQFCNAADKSQELWDINQDSQIVYKFKEEDLARFAVERVKFRAEQRLQSAALPTLSGSDTLDAVTTIKALLTIFRLHDLVTEPMREMIIERLTEQPDLVRQFGIPMLEDVDGIKPLHNHAVPNDHGGDVYERVRMQVYWMALHMWLIHNKQYALQEDEGLFGSAICAFITRRLHEWQWAQVRGFMHDVDVPVMSLTSEVQDMQEFYFGLCVALDGAFKEEAPEGTAKALALEESELASGRYGLAPRLKHVLWANVYSGGEPHDSDKLHELTVYMLRQRAALESLPRGAFFTGQFEWASFPMENISKSIGQ